MKQIQAQASFASDTAKKHGEVDEELNEKLPLTMMSEDEVHFYQGSTVTRKWSLKGKQPNVTTASGRNKVGYYGAVDLVTGRLITMKEEKFTQYTFKTFLDHLLFFNKLHKIILLLDNAMWHHAKSIQKYVEEHEDRIVLLFLPPYSPDLNPIERVWRITRKHCTHNRYFSTVDDLINVLKNQFLDWAVVDSPLKSLCANI